MGQTDELKTPEVTEPRPLDSAGRCSRNQELGTCRSWLALVKSGGNSDIGPVMDDVGVRVRRFRDPVPSSFIGGESWDGQCPLTYWYCWEVTPLFKHLWLMLFRTC